MIPCNYLEPEDAMYIAGFFDGEGCISLSGNALSVTLTQKARNRHILDWVQETTGVGSLLVHKASGCVNWRICSQQAVQFLEQIYPYLKIKDEQAKLALEFQSRITGRGSKAPIEWKQPYVDRMRFLNRKGA